MAGGSDEPRPLRDGLELYLKHLGAPPVDVLTELANRWGELVGPALVESTRPIELIEGVLVVGCDDPAWASQIGWMENQIKDRFAEVFPDVRLTRIAPRTLR